MLAISHATTVLRWQENLLEDEMPPEWMWPLNDDLEEWFEEVSAKRKDKYGGGRDDRDDAPEMMQNTLTRGRR